MSITPISWAVGTYLHLPNGVGSILYLATQHFLNSTIHCWVVSLKIETIILFLANIKGIQYDYRHIKAKSVHLWMKINSIIHMWFRHSNDSSQPCSLENLKRENHCKACLVLLFIVHTIIVKVPFFQIINLKFISNKPNRGGTMDKQVASTQQRDIKRDFIIHDSVWQT